MHAAKPDLIIIAVRQAPLYEQFSEIAPTINLSVDDNDIMGSTERNIRVLGEIYGREADVEKEIALLNEKITKVREKTDQMDETGLILLVNDGKISAYGPGSRFGIIHDVLGIKPADSTIKQSRHGQTASFEYVMDLNPDYLFIVDRSAVIAGNGNTGAKEVVENDLVKNTNAYKNGKIVYLDPNVWYLSGGGFKSTNQMIDDIAEAIDQ
ncbi:siderophore ABC transporter substrate-binding protein [Ignatzschineria indica]|uniref:siderophore ABC transporter substrate-binding protein n=1 Tax=Ignatzschineria indica TaxID=472583 RepID=UPI003628C6F6